MAAERRPRPPSDEAGAPPDNRASNAEAMPEGEGPEAAEQARRDADQLGEHRMSSATRAEGGGPPDERNRRRRS